MTGCRECHTPGRALCYSCTAWKGGQKNVASGHISNLGRVQGRKNAESGHLDQIRTKESCAKGGRIGGLKNSESGHKAVESGRLGRARESPKLKAWFGSPECKEHLTRASAEAHKSPKMRAWLNSSNGKRALARARESPKLKAWNSSENGKAALARGRESKPNPSNEEIKRLHKRLPGWQYDVFIDPQDGGNKIQVDAFRGKVCAFYDGLWWHRPEKRKAQDRRQRGRLERAGYVVRSVFNRTLNDAEVLQWNVLADMP